MIARFTLYIAVFLFKNWIEKTLYCFIWLYHLLSICDKSSWSCQTLITLNGWKIIYISDWLYYQCMHIICLTSSMWKVDDQTKWRSMVKLMSTVQCRAGLCMLSFILLFSEVNCSGADAQVICYPVVFHLIFEQLTIFYGCLWTGSLVCHCLLSSESYVTILRWQWHVLERYINYA